jgi:carbonic anhydrase
MHGTWLLLSILFIPSLLNQIPLATLAAILLLVGYKLAKPAMFKSIFKQGWGQFLPFIVTIIAMLFSDLLKGIGLGMLVAVFIILKNNLKVPFTILRSKLVNNTTLKMILSEDVTFLNKAAIQNSLASIPDNSKITIDATNTHFMHHDVVEIFEDFDTNAKNRNIIIKKIGFEDINEKDTPQHFELNLGNAKTRDDQSNLTPASAHQLLIEGNERFMKSLKLHRDYHSEIDQTKTGQFPFAATRSLR